MLGRFVGNIGEGLTARWMAKQQGKELANLKESNFIAPGLLQAESFAQKLAGATRYAGQSIDEENIRQASNNAVTNVTKASTSPTNLINAGLAVQSNENKAMTGVSRTLQNFKERNNANWTGLLMKKAFAQTQNRNQYEASKSALRGAIMANKAKARNAFWNAGSTLVDAAVGYAAADGGMKGLGAITGGSNNSLAVFLQRMGIQ